MGQKDSLGINRRDVLRATAGAVFAGGMVSVAGIAGATNDKQRYIVTSNTGAAGQIESAGFDVVHSLANDTVLIVDGPRDGHSDLEAVSGVQHVVHDVEFTIDEFTVEEFSTGGSPENQLESDGLPAFWDFQWDKHLMDVRNAHQTATGSRTRIAILDSGIQPGHPELGNLNEAASVAFIDGEKITDGEPIGPTSHGVIVAGVAAAQGINVVGVAPDAELVSVRIIDVVDDALVGRLTDVLLGMEYAAEIGADVANLSFGPVLFPPANPHANAALRHLFERIVNSVTRRGTVLVGPMGNNNLDYGKPVAFLPNTAAGAMGVGATTPDDLRAFYSNYGATAVDVGAPGGGYETIEKTFCQGNGLLAGCDHPDDTPPAFADDCECEPPTLPYPFNLVPVTWIPPGGAPTYVFTLGTSISSPQVAGIAALLREVDPDANARKIVRAIKAGAEGVRGENDPELGAGRVNAAHSIAAIQS